MQRFSHIKAGFFTPFRRRFQSFHGLLEANVVHPTPVSNQIRSIRLGGLLALRILIADDNPNMRAAIRLILQEAGPWEITEAETGEQVLDLAREQTFHLIILDLAMPGMDGISVAGVLTSRYPHVPILMHTLYWSRRVSIEALKVGVKKVIPKSDKATILSAVREILDPESAKLPETTPAAKLPLPPTTMPAVPANEAKQRENPADSQASDGIVPKA
jgi:DNA-binding NarL/FixJ family response regulator